MSRLEDSLTLNIDRLVRDGMIRQGPWFGTLNWTRSGTGEKVASAGYHHIKENGIHIVKLSYHVTHRDGKKHEVNQRIALQTTLMPSGGLRWWFTCPMQRCGRRVGRLHVPPGYMYFGCRCCYNLTYTSCNESHKNDGLYALIARNLGASMQDVKRVMRR